MMRATFIGFTLILAISVLSSIAYAAPQKADRQHELIQLNAILQKHHGGRPVDGRRYGLPKNDFDDATNITVRQRQWFRQLNPNLDYPKKGPVQYPHWAFELMNRLDDAGATVRNGKIYLPNSKKPLDRNALFSTSLVTGPNVNVSNDSTSESETYLAIDPTNANFMVGASNINVNARGQMMYYSSDAGSTWNKVELIPTRLNHSDPGVNFDSTGTVYSATLDYTGNKTQVKFYKSTNHGATWPTQLIVNDVSGNDKELAAIDYQTNSSCKDQIYIGWDNGKGQQVSSTTAPNSGVFRAPTLVQSKPSFNIACDLAVGPPASAGAAGPVYYAWTNTGQKAINFSKSTDCGATWTAYKTIATTNDVYDFGIPAQCVRRVLIYPAIDVDRSNSTRKGYVYAVWNDFTVSQSSGCPSASTSDNANVFFSRSTNGGTTWSTPVIVHQDLAKTDQFNPWMRVDDSDGTIYISWHDTRNDPTNRAKTDVYYTYSRDGGLTFAPEAKITTEMTDESASDAGGNQYGDYEGLATKGGCFYSFWTDRRPSSGTDEEVFTARICP